jgi:UDP-N-acetylglucosamine/UDP-N-acetylgalactosamine diphosphorylase
MMNYQEVMEKLERYGQQHLLQYYTELNETEKIELLAQIEETNFEVLKSIDDRAMVEQMGEISPLAAMEITDIIPRQSYFQEIGINAIKEGKVGAILLAGGMGTRLGVEEPKGMFDIGLTRSVFIFQRLIENMMKVVKQADAWITLYIMTSDKTHDRTVDFFEEKQYFGYSKEHINFFRQDMAPASDYDGKVLLESKGKIATSPNGNGGWYASMHKCGLARAAIEQGIEWFNVFAVDNVLQQIADPCFVGAVIESNCAAGAKVVRKNAPDEKVGVICLEDGHPSIIEYYDLTPELQATKDDKGEPAYNFGVILNYLFKTGSLEEIWEKQLPLHVVEKKIPCLDENGLPIVPTRANGYKYEQLVLDMIRELDSCLAYEVVRWQEFAPIKNQTGVDSVESARALCLENGIEL